MYISCLLYTSHYLFSRCKIAKSRFIMNSDSGDRTWGHLAETELFGRVSDSADHIEMSIDVLDKPQYHNCTHACHCMIFARNTERIFNVYCARAAILVSLYRLFPCSFKLSKILKTSHFIKFGIHLLWVRLDSIFINSIQNWY